MKKCGILASILLVLGNVADVSGEVSKGPATLIREADITGGIIVCVDLNDSEFITGFALKDTFTVQALTRSTAMVDKMRQALQQTGVYGQISVNAYNGKELPYIDNLVNLVVCPETTDVSREELLRVIAPGGALMVKSSEGWKRTIKPRPKGMDEWNQHLYNADNTGASSDVTGPPQRMRWHNTPDWGRSKSKMPSITSMVSANGVLFTIEDHATTEDVNTPQQYYLVARDAFNGIELWKRLLPHWGRLGGNSIKSIKTEVQRLLAAVGKNVYSALGHDKGIAEIAGKTGETIQVYKGTKKTKEFLIADGVLYGVQSDSVTQEMKKIVRRRKKPTTTPDKYLYAINIASGAPKWKVTLPKGYVLGSFCVKGSNIVLSDTASIVCLNPEDGTRRWETAYSLKTEVVKKSNNSKRKSRSSVPPKSNYATLLIAENKVFCAGFPVLDAYDIRTGKHTWRGKVAPNYTKSADLFYAAGLIWSGQLEGMDPATGNVVRKLKQKMTGPMGHDRCWRNKITNRYFINSKTGGTDLIDLTGKGELPGPWVRSTCGLGAMPANNMVYTGPYVCMCSIGSMIPGFNALYCENIDTPDKKFKLALTPRVTKGSALGNVDGAPATASDWPAYRRSGTRGAVNSAAMSANIVETWEMKVGPRPTAPVIVGSSVYLASQDTHMVYALDVANGKTQWAFTAGGTIDSPPTYYRGMLLVGGRDGIVYCLRASDGALVWRFDGLPSKRLVCDRGQLESAWPVNGSLLIHNDLAYFCAGRSSYLDGGIALFALNPQTGEVVHQNVMSGPYDDKTELFPSVAGAFRDKGSKADVLSASNGLIYMRHQAFKNDLTIVETKTLRKSHLIPSPGFLNDTPQHRTYWTVDTDLRYGGPKAVVVAGPIGDIIAYDGTTFYEVRGYAPGRNLQGRGRGMNILDTFSIFSGRKAQANEKGAWQACRGLIPETGIWKKRWETKTRFAGHALAVGKNMVVAAGVPLTKNYSLTEANNSLEGKKGGVISFLSEETGEILVQKALPAPPTWDGVALSDMRCVVTMKNGSVSCFKGE